MMRPSLTKTALLATPQRRWKTLVKNTDDDQNVYYTLFNKRKDPDRPQRRKQPEPFQIDELLLGLDEYERRGVRTFTEQDEVDLQDKFRYSPRQTAVHDEMKDIRAQVKKSQRRIKLLKDRLVHPAHIHGHDVLSMALQGVPREISTGEQPVPEYWTSGNVLEKLRVENAIPEHAAKDESRLLEWMLRRHKQLQVFRTERVTEEGHEWHLDQASTHLHLKLGSSSSVTSIRRLLASFFALISAPELLVSPGTIESICVAYRNACMKALSVPEAATDDSLHEALILTGNLIERFERWKIATGRDCSITDLHLLGLRLSAMAGLPDITSEYLYRNFHKGVWDDDYVNYQDVASPLRRYVESPPGMLDAKSMQLLLQLMTGIDENGALVSESFRGLVLRASFSEAQPAYIALLGRLGARRTLLKEQQNGVFLDTPETMAAFDEALKASAMEVDDEAWKKQTLEECILEDYAAIV